MTLIMLHAIINVHPILHMVIYILDSGNIFYVFVEIDSGNIGKTEFTCLNFFLLKSLLSSTQVFTLYI